jgi:hypothetical protein
MVSNNGLAKSPKAPTPELTSELSRRQTASLMYSGGVGSAGLGLGAALAGFGVGLAPSTYYTYRLMSRDPTLALARAMAKLPIKSAKHSFEADDGVPDQAVQAVQNAVDRIWGDIVDACLWALEYGWKSAEIIWEMREGLLVPARIKPLSVDDTQILVDPDTGTMVGVRQVVDLRFGKYLYFANEVEDQNYYGVSRHENVRQKVWAPWNDLMARMHTYFAKGAGVIPIARYPIGDGAAEGGTNDDNYKNARKIIDDLTNAKGICFPQEVTQQMLDAVRSGAASIKDLSAWSIDFLEAKAGHGDEFLGAARYYDSLKMRGWLVPERAGLEGQNGTKAEAETHGDVGIGVAEDTHARICAAVTDQIVAPMLSFNFGPDMATRVRIEGAALVDESRALIRDIVKAVLTNPASVDILKTSADFNDMMDQAGVPKLEQVVDINTPAIGAPQAQQAAALALTMVGNALGLARRGKPKRAPVVASNGTHKWACAYAPLPSSIAAVITALGYRVGDEYLSGDGREQAPHVTIKYGIGTDDPESVRSIIEASPPIKVTFGSTSVFTTPDADVLKFDVYSDGLRAINDAIDAAVPHVDTHDWYQPHVTVAYLKPGSGQLFAGDNLLDGQTAVIDRAVFSDRAGNETVIMFGVKPPPISLDCGTGNGGFKPGNDCAKETGAGAKLASADHNKKHDSIPDPSSTEKLSELKELTRDGSVVLDEYVAQGSADDKHHYAMLAGQEFADKGNKATSQLGNAWGKVYDQTQRKLSEGGVKTLRAYRGMSIPSSSELGKAIESGAVKEGDVVSARGMKFASWSTDPKVAHTFANSTHDVRTTSIIVERVIPAKDIVSSYKTQRRVELAGESEVIAMNRDANVRIRIKKVISSEDAMKFADEPQQPSANETEYDLTPYDDQRGIGKAKPSPA